MDRRPRLQHLQLRLKEVLDELEKEGARADECPQELLLELRRAPVVERSLSQLPQTPAPSSSPARSMSGSDRFERRLRPPTLRLSSENTGQIEQYTPSASSSSSSVARSTEQTAEGVRGDGFSIAGPLQEDDTLELGDGAHGLVSTAPTVGALPAPSFPSATIPSSPSASSPPAASFTLPTPPASFADSNIPIHEPVPASPPPFFHSENALPQPQSPVLDLPSVQSIVADSVEANAAPASQSDFAPAIADRRERSESPLCADSPETPAAPGADGTGLSAGRLREKLDDARDLDRVSNASTSDGEEDGDYVPPQGAQDDGDDDDDTEMGEWDEEDEEDEGKDQEDEVFSLVEEEEPPRKRRKKTATVRALNPRDGILAANTPLAVFSNQLFALARPAVQRDIGEIVRYLRGEASTRSDPSSPLPSPPRAEVPTQSASDSLLGVARHIQQLSSTSALANFRRIVATIEAAVLLAKHKGSLVGGNERSDTSVLEELVEGVEVDAASLYKAVGEGRTWARWLVYGGVPLVIVLSVLVRLPTLVSPASISFLDLVTLRTKNGLLLDEFIPEEHPYSFASVAFSDYLRPTLATIASYSDLVIDFLGERRVVTAWERKSQRGSPPTFWLPPFERFQVQRGSLSDDIRKSVAHALLARPQPIMKTLGVFNDPIPRPEPYETTACPLTPPLRPAPDRTLRIFAGVPSVLAQTIEGLAIPNASSVASATFAHHIASLSSLPRATLDVSHPLDLTPARLGIQNPSQPRRDWDTNRPGRFFLPGEEDVTERVGYEKVGRRARAKMEDEVSGSKGLTKRGLLRRMEKMAGGGEKLVEGLSRAVEGAKKIESLKELEQMKKEGFTLGKEFVRLAVSDAVVEIMPPPPASLPSNPAPTVPLATLLPPSTIPLPLSEAYISAQRLIFPDDLMHNIGVICKNDECTTCATARERTEPPAEDAPVVLPKLARHQPDDSLDEVLGVDRRFVEVVARVTGSSQLRKQKRARATGESVVQAWGDGAAVIRLAPSFRTASFVMWDQVTWSGAKFGERWTGEEDEATGLRVMGGSGTGNGAVWRDSTLTKTLGYIFDAYGERVSPFFQFQRDLLRAIHPHAFVQLDAGLAGHDGDGDGNPFWPWPWAGGHPSTARASAMMRAHLDGDRDGLPAALAHFGNYEGGELTFPELLAASGGGGGSMEFIRPSDILHAVAKVKSGVRWTSDSAQNACYGR
ncbi:RHTO0S02e01618g2_1 [Rhodotorula toruloides]|uniref:RHTO0S02e01618g2_1 n=1 Tax=Rhodotorula toruloides TaxID=5286 RepID=A0A061AH05_RHOTO|nr:RHTO0S02e01618g2_1 [Rhodotorula toruloides]